MPHGRFSLFSLSILACLIGEGAASAQDVPVAVCEGGTCSTSYKPSFFSTYAPVSAFDMVQNLPGFALDDGDDDTRGFGATAGNVLINGERISAKTETPSDILARIPAADVVEIILIRGQTAGLDVQGQTVVANVIRKGGSASGTWKTELSTYQPAWKAFPSGEGSFSSSFNGIDFTIGAYAARTQSLANTLEREVDETGGVLELRDERFEQIGKEYGASANLQSQWGVGTYALNISYGYEDQDGGEVSVRTPSLGPAFQVARGVIEREEFFEIGADAEFQFSPNWSAKIIGLYRQDDEFEGGALTPGEVGAPGATIAETDFDTLNEETVARLELDFRGLRGHLLEASVEGAVNRLESAFTLRELEDDALVEQVVPGAVTTVEERRLDFLLSDTFRLGSVAVDLALGGETSNISQEGGFAEDRSFLFWKPSLTATYAPDTATQVRGRVLRTVGQLDFFDFVSAADLDDQQLELGNPNLSPETTVTVDLTVERRLGSIGVVSLTGFHDWIKDVEDVLPLAGGLEVPGNIGTGRRSGVRGDVTFPLDRLGLVNGRFDASGEWQTSGVTDLLTGERRRLSGERAWEWSATARQDFERAKFAWSLTFFGQDHAPQFGSDEIDFNGRRIDLDGFIETRQVEGLRIRLGFENMFRDGNGRDRIVFDGNRPSGVFAFRELRDQDFAREIYLEVSGTF